MNLTCGGVEGHAHSSAQAKACKLLQPEKTKEPHDHEDDR